MPSFELFNCFNSIFYSANLLFKRKNIPYDDKSLIKATLDHFKSPAQFKIDGSRGTAECRSSVR